MIVFLLMQRKVCEALKSRAGWVRYSYSPHSTVQSVPRAVVSGGGDDGDKVGAATEGAAG